MHVLILENVTKYYGQKKILDNISFSIDTGEIFALLGPNGAGKTTLMRIIAEGIEHDGEILFKGEKLADRSVIGYCPQEGILYEELSAYDNLKFYSFLHRKDSQWARKILSDFSIPNKKVKQLSGGMKKRLSIAVALVGEPDVLILDEPTTGLDVESRRKVWEIIVNLKKKGKGILLSTHYMEEAEALADRVAIINEGSIVALDTVDALKKLSGIRSAVEIHGSFTTVPDGFVKNNSAILYYTDNPREDIAHIVAMAGRYGKIREVIVREPTLEDVFIKLTGRGLGE